jgi:hypothetical protein
VVVVGLQFDDVLASLGVLAFRANIFFLSAHSVGWWFARSGTSHHRRKHNTKMAWSKEKNNSCITNGKLVAKVVVGLGLRG